MIIHLIIIWILLIANTVVNAIQCPADTLVKCSNSTTEILCPSGYTCDKIKNELQCLCFSFCCSRVNSCEINSEGTVGHFCGNLTCTPPPSGFCAPVTKYEGPISRKNSSYKDMIDPFINFLIPLILTISLLLKDPVSEIARNGQSTEADQLSCEAKDFNGFTWTAFPTGMTQYFYHVVSVYSDTAPSRSGVSSEYESFDGYSTTCDFQHAILVENKKGYSRHKLTTETWLTTSCFQYPFQCTKNLLNVTVRENSIYAASANGNVWFSVLMSNTSSKFDLGLLDAECIKFVYDATYACQRTRVNPEDVVMAVSSLLVGFYNFYKNLAKPKESTNKSLVTTGSA